MQIRILLADPHAILREGLCALLQARDDLVVVGETGSGSQALHLIERLQPRVAVVEFALPGIGGVEIASRLARGPSHTRVLLLSAHDGRNHVERALRAGAAGYIVKTESVKELFDAVNIVARDGAYISPTVVRHVVNTLAAGAKAEGDACERLTQREREILVSIANGLGSREIAGALGVSIKTVDTHRASIMEKLDIHKVAGLVRFAVREGLIVP